MVDLEKNISLSPLAFDTNGDGADEIIVLDDTAFTRLSLKVLSESVQKIKKPVKTAVLRYIEFQRGGKEIPFFKPDFWKLFIGNYKTIKEIAKVGLPFALGYAVTNNIITASAATLVGKAALDTLEFWYKKKKV